MPSAVAIFVHGFTSSAKAWRQMQNTIALDQQLTEAYDFQTFEYASHRFSLRPSRRIPTIDSVADKLRAYLQEQTSTYERIILVGHSQGGLVIQRLLARALANGRGRELVPIRKVVLFACPNSGSEYVLLLRRGLGVFLQNDQERELRPLSAAVAETHRRVINNVLHAIAVSDTACPIPIAVYTGEEDNVVYHESAAGMFPNALVLPGDHRTIIRPKSPKDMAFTALKRHLLAALQEPFPLTVEEQRDLADQAAANQFFELVSLTPEPLRIRVSRTVEVDFSVHAGPVEKLEDIDIIVSPENDYMQMAHFFRPSISGRLRRAAAEKSGAGEITSDIVHDELNLWLREFGKYGLPVPPGTVAPTSAGTLAAQGIKRIYHAAIASPRVGERDYYVHPNAVSNVVHEVFSLARKERKSGALGSLCFPLLGAGSGGLDPKISFERIWRALVVELRADPAWSIHFIEWRSEHANMLVASLEEKRAQGLGG